MKLRKNDTYYTGTVYEWNLPAGVTCPFAKDCKVIVDRETGKFSYTGGNFKCYAASAERFPSVRTSRWFNYEFVKAGGVPIIPKDCENVRIHSSGDFFSQAYFDMWLNLIGEHPEINFWAFTKSINFWIYRLEKIPENLILTASYGGVFDKIIPVHNLKSARVYADISLVPAGMPIDTNDDYARMKGVSFALLDNHKHKKK